MTGRLMRYGNLFLKLSTNFISMLVKIQAYMEIPCRCHTKCNEYFFCRSCELALAFLYPQPIFHLNIFAYSNWNTYPQLIRNCVLEEMILLLVYISVGTNFVFWILFFCMHIWKTEYQFCFYMGKRQTHFSVVIYSENSFRIIWSWFLFMYIKMNITLP